MKVNGNSGAEKNVLSAIGSNFLGRAPRWYKILIISYLIINPILFAINPFVAGWVLMAEFISTLALALVCYPLPSGGLLAIEAVVIGMTSAEHVYHHVVDNFPVLLLLMFMVAGIFFMKELLLFIFTRLLVSVRSKILLSLIFCFLGAFLSAFLDALTVTAVVITVAYGFYGIYHKYASNKGDRQAKSIKDDDGIDEIDREDLNNFRGFLRNLMMHAAVGTALGGALTLVGEPQNLIIGKQMGWDFIQFFKECSPVSVPVFFAGLVTCVLTEVFKILGYGYQMPENVRKVLEAEVKRTSEDMDVKTIGRYIAEAAAGVFLIIALALHLAEVGLVGLTIIILVTSFTGVIEEHHFGEAFTESLPFTALLVVFFTIVAVIAISDNVFVATVYITEVVAALKGGIIDQLQADKLAVATNMGTNIPSVATPNGQAAFLFLLTSTLAPLIRLSYLQMMKLALPYTIIMTTVALIATYYNL